ncbi:MAG: SAM-dependent methyltransferase [Pseudomonadota bacterium]
MFKIRPGEVTAPIDPAALEPDAGLTFIGRIRTSWKTLDDCPKNPRIARERAAPATVEMDEAWRPALQGLEAGQWIHLLYWMGEARRDLVVQHPSHRPEPMGTFALRSPARPNPVALSVVRLEAVDAAAGELVIDAIDCLDGTALLDIKPWIDSVDAPQS